MNDRPLNLGTKPSLSAQSKQTNLPIWIPISILGVMLMISLTVQLILAWQSYQRIKPVSNHMSQLEELQYALSAIEVKLADLMPEKEALNQAARRQLQELSKQLLITESHLDSTTPSNIRSAQNALNDLSVHPKLLLLNVLKILRTTFRQKAYAHKRLTESVSIAAKFEMELGIVIMLILPASAITLLFLMRSRIFKPLQQMSYLME